MLGTDLRVEDKGEHDVTGVMGSGLEDDFEIVEGHAPREKALGGSGEVVQTVGGIDRFGKDDDAVVFIHAISAPTVQDYVPVQRREQVRQVCGREERISIDLPAKEM